MATGTRELRLYAAMQTCRCGNDAQVSLREAGYMGTIRTALYCVQCLAARSSDRRRAARQAA